MYPKLSPKPITPKPISPKPILVNKVSKLEIPKPKRKVVKLDNKQKSRSNTKKNKKPIYKLLAGNGSHQAMGEFIGEVWTIPNSDQLMINLSDKTTIPVQITGRNNNTKFRNKCIGFHTFRGYPTTKDGVIISITITSIDPNNLLFISNVSKFEYWHFRGVWTVQKNLTVQRSVTNINTLNLARDTGFIKKYKFKFANYDKYIPDLIPGYVYTIAAYRIGTFFYINSVTPFCCPINKPKIYKYN